MAEKKKNSNKLPLSKLGVAGLALGGSSFLLSFVPYLNYLALCASIVGIVFGCIATVKIMQGKKGTMLIGWLGLGLSALAFILCIVMAVVYTNTNVTSSSSNSKSTTSSSSSSSKPAEKKVGDTIYLKSGMEITVNSVEGGLINYDKSSVTKVVVTYKNTSSSDLSYYTIDWKAQNAQGVISDSTYYSAGLGKDNGELDSGKLAPGGTVTGAIYFKGSITKVCYQSLGSTIASWLV